MPKFLVDIIVKYIISHLDRPAVAEAVNKYVLPVLHDGKAKLIAKLREMAQNTENPIDDAAVTIVEQAIDEVLKPVRMLGR